MSKSFYRFALTFRFKKNDEKSIFAEAMFQDLSFPKEECDFNLLSKYIEENGNPQMQSIVFDELYELYVERNMMN